MILRFTIENFLSFKDRVIFSMLPGKVTLKKHHKSAPIKAISALKTAVIYGANASGKSNLVKSIDFGRKLVLNGTKANEPIIFSNFKLDKKTAAEPSRIEYEIQHKNKNYAYGFIFNSKDIIEEWLFEINKKSEIKIFERTNSTQFDLSYLAKKNKKKGSQFLEFTAKGTPRNQLFLTQIRNTNIVDNVSDISDLLNIIDWFQNSLTVIYPSSKAVGAKFELIKNTDLQRLFTEMLDYFDTGINGIEFEAIEFEKMDTSDKIKDDIKNELLNAKTEKKIALLSNIRDDKYYTITKNKDGLIVAKLLKTKHNVAGGSVELFDLKDESDGTRRIIDLIPLVIDFFKAGNVFVVDEIERSLHPNLIYDLLHFLLEKCENINSQLIVATHESVLLTQKLLRRDEIWFVDKDKEGVSRLHSLEDYPIRFDKEVRKDYLFGRYKGIPKFGNRNKISALPFQND